MVTRLLIALIRVYQLTLSRLILAAFGPVCRFEPSCSRYAAACLEGHGALRGSLLSLKRLCKCHPFHPGGYDPPPPPPRGRADAITASTTRPASEPARAAEAQPDDHDRAAHSEVSA
ncbi:Hypothetical protein A7982_04919 [Minicystis rosea]|nr:Hypothetical protein A7982_04919 [Minicystis rosea]